MFKDHEEKIRNIMMGTALLSLLAKKTEISSENLIKKLQHLAGKAKDNPNEQACEYAIMTLTRNAPEENSGLHYGSSDSG